jgi:hypothetical protein
MYDLHRSSGQWGTLRRHQLHHTHCFELVTSDSPTPTAEELAPPPPPKKKNDPLAGRSFPARYRLPAVSFAGELASGTRKSRDELKCKHALNLNGVHHSDSEYTHKTHVCGMVKHCAVTCRKLWTS